MAEELRPDLDSIRERLTEEDMRTAAKLHVPLPAKLLESLALGGKTWMNQLADGYATTGN